MLLEVQWPLAIPSVLSGVNQTALLALNMAIIASLIGAGGLGEELLQSIQNAELGKAFTIGLVILALAFIIDRITRYLATRRRSPNKSAL